MGVFKTKEMKGYKSTYKAITVRCDCNSTEHQIEMSYDIDEEELKWSMFFIEPHLVTYRSFFLRCWAAIRYIFGYSCKYGQWDCITLYREDIAKIKAFLVEYLEQAYKE